MKLGCCLNMLGNSEEPIGRAFIETAQEAGYEYVELPLAQVMELDRQEFDGLLAQLGESGICCRACNNFFPAAVRLTGEDVCPEKVKDYIKKAVERASGLGAGVIVFGSSGAKNVPEGFDRDDFNVVVIQECTPVVYDEDGNATADWSRVYSEYEDEQEDSGRLGEEADR